VTLRQCLRRIRLSSLPCAAGSRCTSTCAARIFPRPCVREDVDRHRLNIKDIAIRCRAEGPKRHVVRSRAPGTVTPANSRPSAYRRAQSSSWCLCTLDERPEIRHGVHVIPARATADRLTARRLAIGSFVDSLYFDGAQVSSRSENTRGAQSSHYAISLTIEPCSVSRTTRSPMRRVFCRPAQRLRPISRGRERAVLRHADLAFNPAVSRRWDGSACGALGQLVSRTQHRLYRDLVQKSESRNAAHAQFRRSLSTRSRKCLPRLGCISLEVPGWPRNIENWPALRGSFTARRSRPIDDQDGLEERSEVCVTQAQKLTVVRASRGLFSTQWPPP